MSRNKAQSATEYLLTYGWAFLIAAVVIAALYLFVFAPSGVVPSACSFQSGPYCQDLILGSSASLSKLAALISNTNPYPIISPRITVNVSGTGNIQGTCVPNFVLPGGAIICNATVTPAISQSALASGRFTISYIPCPGGNVILCASNQRQSFPGSFNTHSSPLLSPITLNIILSAQNSSQLALSSIKDKLTANVKLLGTPISGATVNFTTTGSAIISPLVSTTDGSGNAASYIYDTVAENVIVTATFANATSNTIVHFQPAACLTFTLGSASPTSNALSVDGVGYSSFPSSLCYAQGSSHSYSFASTVSGGAGIQYVYSGVSGCGLTAQSGTFIASANCTVTATYTTQYLLTTSSSPGGGGTATPSTQYYNTGTPVTLGETPNGGYFFLSWAGTGSGSYSGNTASPTIGMNAVITEQANFYSTSTTTTTSTSTSTTTSTTSTTTTSTSTTSTTIFVATCGGVLTAVGGNSICTFTSNGMFTVTSGSGTVAVLVVAGGGGGGSSSGSCGGGGGGGAGGFILNNTFLVTAQAYAVTVGGGGGPGIPGVSGGNSIFSSIVSLGGGGGGEGCDSGTFPVNGVSGGSGGGGGSPTPGAGGTGGAGTAGQGNSGGFGSSLEGGGGGGAGAMGQNSGTRANNGGVGLASSISGSSVMYAGGGGGGDYGYTGSPGAGSIGQGGTGVTRGGPPPSAGNSGIVIVAYNALGNGTP
ncbi:MAG: Ig-like domain-containing protein [Candidatus Micrarchaeota archaeon]|nr:Ig-like domain-containing protein [Candidatus Micrarchaeota archaeon]